MFDVRNTTKLWIFYFRYNEKTRNEQTKEERKTIFFCNNQMNFTWTGHLKGPNLILDLDKCDCFFFWCSDASKHRVWVKLSEKFSPFEMHFYRTFLRSGICTNSFGPFFEFSCTEMVTVCPTMDENAHTRKMEIPSELGRTFLANDAYVTSVFLNRSLCIVSLVSFSHFNFHLCSYRFPSALWCYKIVLRGIHCTIFFSSFHGLWFALLCMGALFLSEFSLLFFFWFILSCHLSI